MSKTWIARDCDGRLYLYYGESKPTMSEDNVRFGLPNKTLCFEIDVCMCWEVRPGQCREIEITYKD